MNDIRARAEHQTLLAGRRGRNAFTLIEMSIVLVIIGLIVGGIMVGRDLIKAATIWAQITQLEKFQQAAITFRTKYNGLPGDIQKPADFGFFQPSGSGGIGMGNGDGFITQYANDGRSCTSNFDGELTMFWYHLSQAQLIDGGYSANPIPASGNTAALGKAFPRSRINDAAGILAMGLPSNYCGTGTGLMPTQPASKNYFYLGATDATTNSLDARYASPNPWWADDAGVTPLDSQNIDTKIDDGAPLSGSVQPRFSYTIANILPAADNNWGDGCITSAQQYNMATKTRACWLRFDAGF
jgi:prepilin-type N-terminal cleavage/methylation domain-containing protein